MAEAVGGSSAPPSPGPKRSGTFPARPAFRKFCLPFRKYLSLVLALALLELAGCAGSAPRFRAASSRVPPVVQEDDEFRFATTIKAELAREDDRTVDLKDFEKRVAGRPRQSARYANTTPKGLNRDAVLLDVVSYLGVPYRYGGTGRDGIDCSGLTLTVYRSAASRSIPRSTREQFGAGTAVEKADLQFGDLVFFNTTGRTPSHVGIYIEDDLFAHSSVASGVTISSLESTYYRNRYVGARRIVE